MPRTPQSPSDSQRSSHARQPTVGGSPRDGLNGDTDGGARINGDAATGDHARAERRCEQILKAAGRIFAERGYRQTDVQVIADQLGIGKGTVYRYFPTKEELFLATVDRTMHRLTAEINARIEVEPDLLQQLELGCVAYLAFFDRERDAVELFLQERAEFKSRPTHTYFQHKKANIGRWIDLVRRLIDDGVFRDVAPETVVEIISNALYGTMFTNHFAGRDRSFEEQAAAIMDVVLHGVMNRKDSLNSA